jgi:hypothetical protein
LLIPVVHSVRSQAKTVAFTDGHQRQVSEFSKRLRADLPGLQGFQELFFKLCTGEAGVN